MGSKNQTTKTGSKKQTTAVDTTPTWTDELAEAFAVELDATIAEAARLATIEQLKARRNAVLAELASLDDQLSTVEVHLLDTSKVEKPVALCRRVFAAMYGQGRGKCIKAIVAKGVALNTAKTQYQLLHQRYNAGDEVLLAEVAEAQTTQN